MGKKKVQPNYRRRTLRLPDLDHCKLAALNSLGPPASRRVYKYALDQFIAWYCSEPRLAFGTRAARSERNAGTARSLGHRGPDRKGWPRLGQSSAGRLDNGGGDHRGKNLSGGGQSKDLG
jgi:hypothetical protein